MARLASMQAACRWIEIDGNAYLHWHYLCIATVKRQGPVYVTSIEWRACTHTAKAASLGQGVRFVERWVDARTGCRSGESDAINSRGLAIAVHQILNERLTHFTDSDYSPNLPQKNGPPRRMALST